MNWLHLKHGWVRWLVLGCMSCHYQNEHAILIDGSSTVYPISEAVAEEFLKSHESASIAIGESGTGGGFEKFCRGETDISNASRPISSEELKSCQQNHVAFIEMPVAYDGLAVVVHPSNDWVDYLTVAELKKIWQPGAQGKIMRWNQVRASFPDKEIHLYGAGVSSGTYDYFTEAIVGTKRASRGDYTASEDDNVLVQGIATDPLALGYFGLAYYTENRKRLKGVPIDDEDPTNGRGGVLPTFKNVSEGTYQPLTRPEFIYIRQEAAQRKTVQNFVRFYIAQAPPLVREVGYVPLSPTAYRLVMQRFNTQQTGSAFAGKNTVGKRVESFLTQQ